MTINLFKNNIKSRNYCAVLYPQEDNTHANALEYISSHFQSCYITHDRDTDEDGEIKKAHVHAVMTFKNARYQKSVASELGIEANYLEKVSNLDSYLLYLVHYDEPDKFQYSIDDVKGALKGKLDRLLKSESIPDEEEAVLFLKNYISNSHTLISVSDFVTYSCQNGLYKYYRRSPNIFNKMLDEHNNYIRSKADSDDLYDDAYNLDLDTGELTELKERGGYIENNKL